MKTLYNRTSFFARVIWIHCYSFWSRIPCRIWIAPEGTHFTSWRGQREKERDSYNSSTRACAMHVPTRHKTGQCQPLFENGRWCWWLVVQLLSNCLLFNTSWKIVKRIVFPFWIFPFNTRFAVLYNIFYIIFLVWLF